MTSGSGVRVLMYHGVETMDNERDPHGMFVTPDAFRQQIEAMLADGYVAISEAEYLTGLAGGPLPRKAVLVTFDDGYVSVAERAAPILEELEVPSILYVPADLVGRESSWLPPALRHPLLSADEVRDLRDVGMSVGAHGADHADLTQVGAAELYRQTREAREELGRLLGEDVRTFAYPFGAHNRRVREGVHAAGYEAAFAVHDRADGFGLIRVDVNATDTMRTFRLKLNRLYPTAREIGGRVPGVRRAVHDLLGRAERPQPASEDAG